MRALVLCVLLAACGNGEGMKGQTCDVDDDCEKGLSCQDRGAANVCWPDGSKGCKSDDECRAGDLCVVYGTGTFCQAAPVDAAAPPMTD